jgi:hypothetical protein
MATAGLVAASFAAKPTLRSLCQSLVGVRHCSRTEEIARLQLNDSKTRRHDESVYFAIEVTTTADPLPSRCQAVLPRRYSTVRGLPVLDEKHATSGL